MIDNRVSEPELVVWSGVVLVLMLVMTVLLMMVLPLLEDDGRGLLEAGKAFLWVFRIRDRQVN